MIKVKSIPADKISKFCRLMKIKNEKYYILAIIGISNGLRVSDILSLQVKQYNKRIIKERKTGKRRQLKFTPSERKEINDYIHRHKLQDSDYLIYSRDNKSKPLSRRAVLYTIKAVGNDLGLKGIGTHSMRKTFSKEHFKRFKDIDKLQQTLNHKYVSTTLLYLFDDLNKIKLE